VNFSGRNIRELQKLPPARECARNDRFWVTSGVLCRNEAISYCRILSGSTPIAWQNWRYAAGAISLGLISLLPPQKTLV
jgi:hypothetical protein